MKAINIKSKFDQFDDHWSPKIIAELNGQHIKLAKIQGEFVWHNHEDEDEMFLVYKGTLNMEFRDKCVVLNEGEMVVVPKGVDHRPIADDECWLLLFEPIDTKHTGDIEHQLTVKDYDVI